MTVRSLYEQLFPLSIVMGQRVVDNFDGDSLNDRWFERNLIGSSIYIMEDAVDEGFSITTDNTNNSLGGIDFNSKRQYAHDASVLLCILRAEGSTSSANLATGFMRDVTSHGEGTEQATMGVLNDIASNFSIRTSDGAVRTAMTSGVAIDTNFHLHKLELTSTNNLYSIDGVLKATKTDRRPDQNMQPLVFAQQVGTQGGREVRTRFLEAYNT